MTTQEGMQASDIIIRKEGRAGRITLNRPQALNAVTHDQVVAIEKALDGWSDDEDVQLVMLDGAGGKALCAGGDVISLYKNRADGGDLAARFWRAEYRLNAMINRYPKPYVAMMNGIVMGGGIGLSAHGSHRIVSDNSMLAMPETMIGLIPDVGGLWLLAHAPGYMGEYFGLLGERMGAADALYANFADTFIAREKQDAFISALADPEGDPIGVSVAAFASAPPPAVHASRQDEIDRIFAAPTVEDIKAALEASTADWTEHACKVLSVRSPLALKLTLAGIRQVRQKARALEDSLNLEYRLTTRLYESSEFLEGVRALLIDKDKAPKWTLPTLDAVDEETLAHYLAPLTKRDELGLSAQ
ncbi:MAG: enoyl-CoA hydratase/isomerase family protein [Pseudomonadota bacterium]